jgi:hypothetical protein
VSEGELFEVLAYLTYIMERYYFSLEYTFKQANKNVEVTVDVQKGGLRV